MSLVGNFSLGGDPRIADEKGAECETAFTLVLHSRLVGNLIRENEAGRECVPQRRNSVRNIAGLDSSFSGRPWETGESHASCLFNVFGKGMVSFWA